VWDVESVCSELLFVSGSGLEGSGIEELLAGSGELATRRFIAHALLTAGGIVSSRGIMPWETRKSETLMRLSTSLRRFGRTTWPVVEHEGYCS